MKAVKLVFIISMIVLIWSGIGYLRQAEETQRQEAITDKAIAENIDTLRLYINAKHK